MILDAGNQRRRQCATAALRDAKAEFLEETEEDIHADARRLLVRRDEIFAGDAGEMHAHFIALEQFAQMIMAAHLHDAPQFAALIAAVEHGIAGSHRHGRRVERGLDHRQPLCRLRRDRPKRLGILLRILRDGRSRALAVAIQLQGSAILKDRHHRNFGEEVIEIVAGFEAKLIVQEQWIALDEDVAHRVLVMPETRLRQLARDDAAPEPGIALQHQHLLARNGRIGRSDEAVMAGADGNDVCVTHGLFLQNLVPLRTQGSRARWRGLAALGSCLRRSTVC